MCNITGSFCIFQFPEEASCELANDKKKEEERREMTNAQKIRSLTADELALVLYHISVDTPGGYGSYFINRRYCELGKCGKRDECCKLNTDYCLADSEAGVPYSEYIWWLKKQAEPDEWEWILKEELLKKHKEDEK
jgi:hypothetical protein